MRQQISHLTPKHLPSKNEACRICKKIGHFAKLCKSEMPPQPQYNIPQRRQQRYSGPQQQRNNQWATKQTSQRMRKIREEETEDTQEKTEETIDPESTCYIREMMEEWQNINFLQSVSSQTKMWQTSTKQKDENSGYKQKSTTSKLNG